MTEPHDAAEPAYLAAAAPTAGLTLSGRYTLIKLLGRGATAQVWQARDETLGRDVAVKIFDERGIFDDASTRQVSEMRLLAGLNHHGLVTVFDAGGGPFEDSRSDFAYLVMDLVDGRTLSHRLDVGPLSPALAADVGRQLAEALAYVHGRRIVHRDVKPANVLLTDTTDGLLRAKLTDFGIARLLDRSRMTAFGLTVGTANYLSPEQATGGDVGPASDVYALGLVLIECLTGVVAYPGHGIEAAVARLHRAPRIPDDIADQWRTLLAAMTAYEPQNRPSMSAVAARLRTIDHELDDPAAQPTVLASAARPPAAVAEPPAGTTVLGVPSRRHRRRAATWVGVGAGASAAAVAVALIASSLATQSTTHTSPQPSTSASAGAGHEQGGAEATPAARATTSRAHLTAPRSTPTQRSMTTVQRVVSVAKPGRKSKVRKAPGAGGPGAKGPGAKGPGKKASGAPTPGAKSAGAKGPGKKAPSTTPPTTTPGADQP